MTGAASLTTLVPRIPGTRRRLERDLRRLAAWTAEHYGQVLDLSFVVVDDVRMAELHERYAGVPGPTDVLSFPLAANPVLLGEVVISADTARREAAVRGHPAYDELLLYAVHGVMHLVGHDDHDAADRRRMRSAERRALAALGRVSVYRHQASPEEILAVNPAEENEVRRILEKGLCTQEQIQEAEAIQRQMEAMGLRPRSVPEVLCEKGFLESRDLQEIQKEETTIGGRDRIAGYEVVELLGRGAMGAVYKARQVSLDRIVALKVLDPDLAKDEGYASRFLEEARSVARLSHTNLISGIDVGEDDGIPYLVMEYADGVTLARLLHRGGAMDEERALLVAQQVARALDHAHKGGVVHGDVRPENVIITSDRVTKLCDLGIARRPLIAGDDRSGEELRRTPDYISPEQARGHTELTPGADIYGLGATLFHMLTGRVLFPSESREAVLAKQLTEPAPSARPLVPELTAETEAILVRCLQKGPAERYPTAAALGQALDAAVAAVQAARSGVATAAPAGAAPTGGAPQPRKRRRRR